MSRLKNVGTFAIESLWTNSVKKPIPSVEYMFSLLQSNLDIEYAVLNSNTREEIEHSLDLASKNSKDFRMLYFAQHGRPFELKISLERDNYISLDEIAEMMGDRFRLWAVHMGSCSVLSGVDEKDIKRFMDTTGIRMLTGYTKDVDWMESTAFEILWFSYLYDGHENLEKCRKVWNRKYNILNLQNGFRWILKGEL